MDTSQFNEYERRAWEETQRWRKQPPGAVARRIGQVLQPVEKAVEKAVIRGPVRKALEAGTKAAMDAGSWTVKPESILGPYREAGYAVERLEDIPRVVPLDVIDERSSKLPAYYYGSMGAQGAGAGAASFLGPGAAALVMTADIASLTVVSCRAVSHFAALYGYDTSLLHERHYAMTVLGASGVLTEAGKASALAEVTRVSGQIARKKTWDELSKSALVQTLQRLARRFGADLTKRKLGQLVWGVGVVIGGGLNTWYVNEVCETAYYSYRERFLKDQSPLAVAPAAEAVTDAEVVEDTPAETSA